MHMAILIEFTKYDLELIQLVEHIFRKKGLIELLNCCYLKGICSLSLYSLHKTTYRVLSTECIFISQDKPPNPRNYIPLINEHSFFEFSFSTDFQTVNFCLKHISEESYNPKFFLFTTSPKNWKNHPIEVHEITLEIKLELKELLQEIRPEAAEALIIVQSDESSLELKVECRSLQFISEWSPSSFELFIECLVTSNSLSLEYIFGNSWVVQSNNWEFTELWEWIEGDSLVLIASSSFDSDNFSHGGLPVHYGLFPCRTSPEFLLKKIHSSDIHTSVKQKKSQIHFQPSPTVALLKSGFEIDEYSPNLLSNGMHEYLSNNCEVPEPQITKKTLEKARKIAKSIKRGRKRK